MKNTQSSFFPVLIQIGVNESIIRKPSDLPTGEAFTILQTRVGRNHPHRSTTVEERYYHVHVEHEHGGRDYVGATVFMRKEPDGWKASVARCFWADAFQKSVGRNVARRRYFNGHAVEMNENEEPSYDTALAIVKENSHVNKLKMS